MLHLNSGVRFGAPMQAVSAKKPAPVFGNQTSTLRQPVFVSPKVVTNLPAFDPKNPDVVTVYQGLLVQAQGFARPDVSGRRVGAIAIGESGRAYLGANIEIKGGLPADTLHAEPSALALARSQGESRVLALVQTLQPCGSCRQIIRETGDMDLPVHTVDAASNTVITKTIGELFPFAYSYAKPELNMFKAPELPAIKHHSFYADPFERSAINSGQQSYLPNPGRKAWAGIAVELKNGKRYLGNVTTISGPNPTITPIQDILVRISNDNAQPGDIAKVVVAEPQDADYSFYGNTQSVLERLAPQAQVTRFQVKTG